MPEPLDHIFIVGFTDRQDFKSTLSVRKEPVPQRPRQEHGERLLAQLSALTQANIELQIRREALDLPPAVGITIALEISPPGSIDYGKQLEWKRDGIEVLSAVDAGGTEIVTLHVPDGSLAAFEKRVLQFLQEDTVPKDNKPSKPKNAALVNALANIRRAAFTELWTDDSPSPAAGAPVWLQVWLRATNVAPAEARRRFAESAEKLGIALEPGYVKFPGRVVVAVFATREALELAADLLDLVAEIRSVSITADFFLADLKPFEQAAWVQNLADRCEYAPEHDAPFVTLLDTGVNSAHPLLAPLLDDSDKHAIVHGWQTTDHEGHGTAMAGLATHGDLTAALASAEIIQIPHRLESVKILPPQGQTEPHLYGWVTSKAAETVEQAKPDRRRTFVTMTTSVGATAGLPSEWSATIDRLAFGMSDDDEGQELPLTPRLFVLAAGNVPWPDWGHYPVTNDLAAIENPAQAWNALTVGACTDLTSLDTTKWPSLSILSQAGSLSPSSTTSLLWRRTWPFKPDVVAEGGNGCLDANMANQVVVGPESLRLLTTSHDFTYGALTEAGDTSAAAAEVARVCGHLQARYPDYWPETIRALVVHGARFTPAMRGQLPLAPLKRDKENLLRRFGYGCVSLDESLNSSMRNPTLIVQETMTPYEREKSSIKLGQLCMHELPWPAEVLQQMPDATVEMRVTLSYFVEPNPSRRGWQSKFRYQSHGLRFAVKGATEDELRFRQRINKIERDEMDPDDVDDMGDPDGNNWFLRAHLRSRGSLHSDVWRGTAAQLAEKSHVAVFPVGGWWKDWKEIERYDSPVRYTLVVSLAVLDEVEVDLYTPISNAVAVSVPIVGV